MAKRPDLVDLPPNLKPAEIRRDMELYRCERSLVAFIKKAWQVLEPSMPYVHNWHIDLIAEHLEAIDRGEEVDGKPYNRLLINLPPGGMKSLILNVFFPAWVWGPRNKPYTRFLCAAHKMENLAERDAGKFLMLVTSEWYQSRWGDRVVLENDAKSSLQTKATGFRIATAIGSLTGIRADYVMIDDPHNVKSAASDVTMAGEVTNFREAIPTRLNDPIRSVIIVIMQRLHEGDISGVIIEDLNKATPGLWDHICLPMRYESWRDGAVTQLGTFDPRTEDGELFFPERFPLDVVERDEASMGPYGTAAQFAQTPAPRGGGIIKDEWWRKWEPRKGTNAYPPFDVIIGSLDTAYTTKETNDYSAMTFWGVFTVDGTSLAPNRSGRFSSFDEFDTREYAESSPRALMTEAWQERLDFHDLIEKVGKSCLRRGVDTLLIESKAAGISVAQELRRVLGPEKFAIRLVDPKNLDKVSRLYAVQHLFAEGIVYAPDKEFVDMVLAQVRTFPKGKHDDIVDTVSMALSYLRNAGYLTRSQERIADVHEQIRHSGRALPPLYTG